jgi:dsRNA-specific ribonuclease
MYKRLISTASISLNPSQWSFYRRSFPCLFQSVQEKESILAGLLDCPSSELIEYGRGVLLEAADVYLYRRFPKLEEFRDKQALNEKLFGAESNLRQLSKMIGLEAFDKVMSRVSSSGKYTKTIKTTTTNTTTNITNTTTNITATSKLLALIGLMEQKLGKQSTTLWLTKHYFSQSLLLTTPTAALLPHALLAYPIPHLTAYLRLKRAQPGAELVFRLHQESGRCSNSSMFIVGVYDGSLVDGDMLGEGAGPSVSMAQRRASLDALERIYLK